MNKNLLLITNLYPPQELGGYGRCMADFAWGLIRLGHHIEVLSADAFAAFEEAGMSNEDEIKSIGKQFRNTILSLGGSKPPKDVFEAFRGREARSDALIRHSGLISKD